MVVVDTGIASANRESFFVANLYTVKGEAYEAMANLLDDEQSAEIDGGTSPETPSATRARDARRQAIIAFDRAIAINTELQKALLEERAQ